MKKIITLAFLAFVTTVALVGCDQNKTTTTPAPTNNVSTNATP